ncbi:MAG TPA: helix-turn-helix transcriptional regulator [Gemmatimonadaceae bacterium]|nr:helix-turn-helix transcriptional regulator [Gemmatimonadaceae bacterium]
MLVSDHAAPIDLREPDLQRARGVMEIALAPSHGHGFDDWWPALLAALRELVAADHGGLLLHAGRRTHWFSDDARPYVLEARSPRRAADHAAPARAHPVALALRDTGFQQPLGPIVPGLRLSWTRIAQPQPPEACHLLLHRTRRSRGEFGGREQVLLDLVGPAVRAGIDQRRLPHEPDAAPPPPPPSLAALGDSLADSVAPATIDALTTAARQRGLTPRQTEVAVLMGLRRSHKEIARTLGISPNTARRHEERVLKLLGVRRRLDVMRALGGD